MDLVIHYKTQSSYSDDIKDFIDYIELYELIKNSFQEKRFNLLESLGFKILNDIKKSYKAVFYMKINIRKPSLVVDNNQDFINVEVEYKK